MFSLPIETPWYIFNQSYFQYVKIQHTHYDAQKYCEEQNGGLASISSEEEQTFLYNTFLLPDVTGQVLYNHTLGINILATLNAT